MKAVLWDLDDTLLDTIEPRMEALAAAYERCTGSQADPYALWKGNHGGTMEDLGRKILGDECRYFVDAFNEFYEGTPHHPKPYPGVLEALVTLRESDLQLAIVTSRSSWTATEELARSDLLRHFQAVVAWEDTDSHKPDPAPLRHALDRLLLDEPSLVAFVGDSPADVRAAQAIGCPSIAATWGTLDRQQLLETKPDAVASEPGDVPGLLGNLVAG